MSVVNPGGRDVRPMRSPSPANSTHSVRRPNEWAPALGAIPDDGPPALMQHANRSVPSLPSEHYQDSPPPPVPQPYDPTATLDSFSALHVSDPVARAGSAMSGRVPRHANTLPDRFTNDPSYAEASSLYSRNSGGAYDGYEADQASSIYDDYAASYTSPNSVNSGPAAYPAYPQQAWSPQQGQDYNNNNTYYPAPSNALGLGTQPQAQPPNGYGNGYAASQSSFNSYPNSNYPQSDYGQGASYPSSQSTYDTEIETRPSMNREGTAASVSLATNKTKAVDLSAPPYTKEYIDQYRQRIKADPDPESHFLYAKYLVDAARKIRGSGGKHERAAKKYSEVLIGEALKVIRRLATQGQAYDEAQFYLANCYGTGALGLQVDHERAYHLYLQAAKQNHAGASYRVAVCNEIGAGTRKEPPRAAAFYRKAASLGDTAAMYKLGMILLHGHLGEAQNPREAINWLRRAAEQADAENPHALYELALLHQQTDGTIVPYDPGYAKMLFTQAAQLGYTQAQFRLGQCYEFGALTCPVDPRRSIGWYTKAAEKGDPEAELALSGWYLTGAEGILKQSDSEAYLWARRAANKGLSKAEYAVGYYAEVGIGIKQDIDFSKRWYMRAAAQGNKRAMNRLTEMKRMGNKRAGNMARPTRQQAKDECVIC